MLMSQNPILLSTTATIAGYKIVASRGIVLGVTVRSKGWAGDCSAGFESCCGGEVSTYTNVVIEGRNQALNRMIEEANGVFAGQCDVRRSVERQESRGNGVSAFSAVACSAEPITRDLHAS